MAEQVQWTNLGNLNDGTPRGWEARVGRLRITIHTHVDDPAGSFVSCYEISMERHRIGDMPMTEASKPAALRAVRARIEELYDLTVGWDAPAPGEDVYGNWCGQCQQWDSHARFCPRSSGTERRRKPRA
jgi:hypothetical protein